MRRCSTRTVSVRGYLRRVDSFFLIDYGENWLSSFVDTHFYRAALHKFRVQETLYKGKRNGSLNNDLLLLVIRRGSKVTTTKQARDEVCTKCGTNFGVVFFGGRETNHVTFCTIY